jgi:hypothetical protein
MPGQPARARAHFRFPLAIHPRELPAATSVTAIHRLASVESSNVFGEATLGHNVLRRNLKTIHLCAEPVDDETCLWNAEENCGRIARTQDLPAAIYDNLNTGETIFISPRAQMEFNFDNSQTFPAIG